MVYTALLHMYLIVRFVQKNLTNDGLHICNLSTICKNQVFGFLGVFIPRKKHAFESATTY